MDVNAAWKQFDSQQNSTKASIVLVVTVCLVVLLAMINNSDARRSSQAAVNVFDSALRPVVALIGSVLGSGARYQVGQGFNSVLNLLHSLGVVLGIVGFVVLFWGYIIHQLIIMLPGLIIGGAIGASLFMGRHNEIPQLIGLVVGALIGGGIMLTLYALGVFLVGFLIAYTCVGIMVNHLDPNLVTLVAGIVGGIIALILEKFLVILYTSIFGALFVCGGFGLPSAIILIALVLVGIYVQYYLSDRTQKINYGAVKRAPAAHTNPQDPRLSAMLREERTKWKNLGGLLPGSYPGSYRPSAPVITPPAPVLPLTYRVILTAIGSQRDAVINAVCSLTGCDRQLAEETLKTLPLMLFSDATEGIAYHAQTLLQFAGANVIVEKYAKR